MKIQERAHIYTLEASLQQLRKISKLDFCFKPAPPSVKARLSPEIMQHRCTYCMAVKADPANLPVCIASDDGLAAAPEKEPFVRTCPFGVQEWIIPVYYLGRYQGCLFAGTAVDDDYAVPNEFSSLYKTLPEFSPESGRALADIFTTLLARHIEQQKEQALVQRSKSDPVIQKALEIIREEGRVTLRAPEVARRVGLSPSRFLHRFSDCMHQGFGASVRQLVMEKAHHLVTGTDLRIVDISLELGYTSQNHFAQHFKAHFGCTASGARRKTRTPLESGGIPENGESSGQPEQLSEKDGHARSPEKRNLQG